MRVIQASRRRSRERRFAGEFTMTLGTNTTSVRAMSAMVSCGMMLTPVQSPNGPATAATRRGSNSGCPGGRPFMLSHSLPAAHSVSNTP